MEKTIYIADDEPSVLEVLSAFLRRDGFAVRIFPDGKALLAACARELPDLVVLDVVMPGMDGLDVCRALRRAYSHLPVIFISSKVSAGDRAAGMAAGGSDYLCKPFSPPLLSARISALLQKRSCTDAVSRRECAAGGAGD